MKGTSNKGKDDKSKVNANTKDDKSKSNSKEKEADKGAKNLNTSKLNNKEKENDIITPIFMLATYFITAFLLYEK